MASMRFMRVIMTLGAVTIASSKQITLVWPEEEEPFAGQEISVTPIGTGADGATTYHYIQIASSRPHVYEEASSFVIAPGSTFTGEPATTSYEPIPVVTHTATLVAGSEGIKIVRDVVDPVFPVTGRIEDDCTLNTAQNNGVCIEKGTVVIEPSFYPSQSATWPASASTQVYDRTYTAPLRPFYTLTVEDPKPQNGSVSRWCLPFPLAVVVGILFFSVRLFFGV